jgi:hypothetical protein
MPRNSASSRSACTDGRGQGSEQTYQYRRAHETSQQKSRVLRSFPIDLSQISRPMLNPGSHAKRYYIALSCIVANCFSACRNLKNIAGSGIRSDSVIGRLLRSIAKSAFFAQTIGDDT